MLIPGTSYDDEIKRFEDGFKAEVDYSTKCIQPFDWLEIMRNHDLIDWLIWVNRNICLPIKLDTEKSFNTTAVKIRIATGKLNKISSLSDIDKIKIHVNLTTNIKEEQNKLIFSSLPF